MGHIMHQSWSLWRRKYVGQENFFVFQIIKCLAKQFLESRLFFRKSLNRKKSQISHKHQFSAHITCFGIVLQKLEWFAFLFAFFLWAFYYLLLKSWVSKGCKAGATLNEMESVNIVQFPPRGIYVHFAYIPLVKGMKPPLC